MSKPNIKVNEDGTVEIARLRTTALFSVAGGECAKQISTQCGHVARHISRNEPLTGKVLEFALTVVGEDSDIGIKLKNGEQLDEYERHLMLDVYLLHKRLALAGCRLDR